MKAAEIFRPQRPRRAGHRRVERARRALRAGAGGERRGGRAGGAARRPAQAFEATDRESWRQGHCRRGRRAGSRGDDAALSMRSRKRSVPSPSWSTTPESRIPTRAADAHRGGMAPRSSAPISMRCSSGRRRPRSACSPPARRARSSTSPRCWASACRRAPSLTPTAKAGVVQMTKALGLELAFKGVRVNAIAPGWFVTEINRDYLTGRARRSTATFRSAGSARIGDLDGALLLLASDAGSYMAGATSWSTAARWSRCADRGGNMDFTLSPEIEDLRQRTRAFVEEHVLPLESDQANFDEHENIPDVRLDPVREKAKKAGLWAPQSPKEYRRHGPADRRLGGDVRGGGALAVRAARAQLRGARRRQHERAGEGRHAGAEGKVAAARSSRAKCARPSR